MNNRPLEILDLTVEILELFFFTLSDVDMGKLARTCTLFYQIYIKQPQYWEQKLLQHYPSLPRQNPHDVFMRANLALSSRLRYVRYLIVTQNFNRFVEIRVSIEEIKTLLADYPELLNLTSAGIRRYIFKEIYCPAFQTDAIKYGAKNAGLWDTDVYWAVACQQPEEFGEINFNPKKTRVDLSILQVALKYKVIPMINHILSLPISENYFAEGENGALNLALKINDEIATKILTHNAFISWHQLTDSVLATSVRKNYINFTNAFLGLNLSAIFYKDPRENTVFHIAVQNNLNEMLAMLSTHNKDFIFFVNMAGLTPLCIAIQNENMQAVELILFLKHYNDINRGSMPPLLCAIERGNVRIMRKLLACIDTNILSTCIYKSEIENALSLAAKLKFVRAIEILLNHKDFRDNYDFGFKALLYAFNNKDEESISLLLLSPKIKKYNCYYQSILDRLVFLQDMDGMKLLFKYDTSLINGYPGQFESPLYLAIWRNQRSTPDVAMAELLLSVPDIDATNITIAYLKKLHGYQSLINKLLEHSADISHAKLTDEELKFYKFFSQKITLETIMPELDRLHHQLSDDDLKMKNLMIDALYEELKSEPQASELLMKAYRHEIFNKPKQLFKQNFREFLTDISSYRERLLKLIKDLETTNLHNLSFHK